MYRDIRVKKEWERSELTDEEANGAHSVAATGVVTDAQEDDRVIPDQD